MKLVIVNAFGRSNRGDAVLLDECIEQLLRVYPEADIAGVVFEGIADAMAAHPLVKWSERIGSTRLRNVNSKIKTVAYMFFAGLAAVAPWTRLDRLLPASQRTTLNEIRDADIVVSAPGGYIHDTNFAYLVALFHIHLGTILRKTVVLAPQSIGPLRDGFPRWVARRVLSRIPYVCARESYSYAFLTKDLRLNSASVFRAGDSAFWNNEVERDPQAVTSEYAALGVPAGRRVFGMTVVNWSFPRSADPRRSHSAYVAAVAKISDYISENCDLLPVIFNQVSDDLPAAREVQQIARHTIIVDEKSRSPALLRALIGRSTLFLGARFHSCVFAMMAGRPTFAIAYLPKTEFIMKDLSLDARHTPIDAVDVDATLATLCQDLAHLDSAENEISRAITSYRQNFKQLSDIMMLVRQRLANEPGCEAAQSYVDDGKTG